MNTNKFVVNNNKKLMISDNSIITIYQRFLHLIENIIYVIIMIIIEI